jgi:membrane fusion protein, multidrug efflux system
MKNTKYEIRTADLEGSSLKNGDGNLTNSAAESNEEKQTAAEMTEQKTSATPRRIEDSEAETAEHGDQTTDEEPAEENEAAAGKPIYKKPLFVVGAVAVLLVAAIFGWRYWSYSNAHETTDNAFIEGNIVQVSPKVGGYVKKLYIDENQPVKAGDLLAEIEPSDFQIRLDQATANLNTLKARRQAAEADVVLTRVTTNAGVEQSGSVVERARAGVKQAEANINEAQAAADAMNAKINQANAVIETATANVRQNEAGVKTAQTEVERADKDARRYAELLEKDQISRQRYEQAEAVAKTAQSQLEAARKRQEASEAQVREARAARLSTENNYRQSLAQIQQARANVLGTQAQVGEAIGGLKGANSAPQQVALKQTQVQVSSAEIEQAAAAVRQAELELSYTKIYATESGYVSQKAITEGQLIQPGQPLFGIVYGDVWVEANFKETQLAEMQIGQTVKIHVDAYPNLDFEGKVESFQQGTGSRFSILPAENATGNYVKIVQRLPVKIVFTKKPEGKFLLAPGMSVEPEINLSANSKQ